ncbi:MAG: hypothetical protein AAGH70_10780 [Pseudomonadota bacterium]
MTTMTMTLYFATNTIAVASSFALIEAGADFRIETVDVAKTAQRSPDFLYIYAVTSWLEGDGVPLAGFPKIAALRAALETRPSFADARRLGVVA